MPIPQQRDPEVARKSLEAWLASKLDGAAGVSVAPFEVPPGTGFSNETILFDASWTAQGARVEQRLCARIQPDGHQVFPDTDVFLQYRMIKAMGEHTDVPVAPVLWDEPDRSVIGSPFFVMECVTGQAPTDVPNYNTVGFLTEMTAAQREQLWLNAIDVLAGIHKVDWRKGFEFLDRKDGRRPGLDQYLAYVDGWYEWSSRGTPQPVADTALEYVRANRPTDEPRVGVSWGDARVGNIMFDGTRVAAVCDWEMAALGPAELDFGWWLFLDAFHSEGAGIARLPGLRDRKGSIAHYESLLGRPVRDIEYYEILAGLRFAMVIQRFAWMRVDDGAPPEAAQENAANPVLKVLSRLLQEAGAL